MPLPRIEAGIPGTLGVLPFRSATFSQIYFLVTLERLRLDEGRRALEEVRPVSSPGGDA